MKKKSPPLTFSFQIVVLLLLALTVTVGCSHKKTNRGHLYRCEWAFEHNRTPWIGCPPDSGCDDQRGCGASDCSEGDGGGSGILNCFKKDNGKHCSCKDEKNKGFRRHCGMNPECTSKRPCCRTLGCGMWVDPSDPNTFAALGGGVKACGLTAFCSPMKPCCLTPNCGRVVNQPFMNQQMLMLGNNAMPMQGGMQSMPVQGMPVQGMPVTPTPVVPKGQPGNEKNNKKPPTVAGPTGMLISRGIVPGASPIANGGVVAALGVTTPIGMMTPAGVRLPNGMVNANAVIRACAMPGCSAARPCGMTPGCGGLVSVTAVSVNPMMLASATYPNGGVMQAGAIPGYATGGMMTAGGIPMNRTGNGMLVNPVTGQVVAGLTMNGYPQNGYPPIGYAPTGYSPGYPRYAGMNAVEVEEEAEEEPAGLEESAEAEQQSPMPVPRFHPIPSKPVFQRSEGMPVPNRTGPGEKRAAADKRIFSDNDLNAVVEQAYLEGMSDAMDEVEEELEAQAQELAKAQLQEKILNQAKKLQTQIETQKDLEIRALEIQALEMQKRQELAQKKAREQATREKAAREKIAREQAALEVAQAAEQETRLRQFQASQMMQAPIPTGFEQTNQAVYPVNYAANYGGNEFTANGSGSNGAGKNIFASAAQFLKGSGEKPPNPYAASMPTPYIPQRQSASPQYNRQVAYAQQGYGRQDSGSSFDLATTGGNLWNSAKSMGNNVVSAVNGAVSPLSGLLGSDKPQMQYPAQHPTQPTAYPTPQTRRTTKQNATPQAAFWPTLPDSMTAHTAPQTIYPCPCPPSPPFDTTKAARNGSNIAASATHDSAGEVRMNLPKKPPTFKKKPKKMINVDDFEEEGSMILQANYEEE